MQIAILQLWCICKGQLMQCAPYRHSLKVKKGRGREGRGGEGRGGEGREGSVGRDGREGKGVTCRHLLL